MGWQKFCSNWLWIWWLWRERENCRSRDRWRRLAIYHGWTQPVEWAADRATAGLKHVGVDHRGLDAGMAQKFLHGADVVNRRQQMGRERMAQGMGGGRLPMRERWSDCGSGTVSTNLTFQNRIVHFGGLESARRQGEEPGCVQDCPKSVPKCRTRKNFWSFGNTPVPSGIVGGVGAGLVIIFSVTISETIMFTIHRSSDYDCDRDQNRNCDHLLHLCLFESMFAKASCACRKRRRIKELRLEPQWRASCPGYKKTLNIRGGRVRAHGAFISTFTSAITHFAALCALFLRRRCGRSNFRSFNNLRRLARIHHGRPRAKARTSRIACSPPKPRLTMAVEYPRSRTRGSHGKVVCAHSARRRFLQTLGTIYNRYSECSFSRLTKRSRHAIASSRSFISLHCPGCIVLRDSIADRAAASC
jgi:hypothetical protein